MFRYAVIINDYQNSIDLAEEIKQKLAEFEMEEDIINPEYVFVIGGDGTLLRAVNDFQDIIDEVFFIVIKSGSLGFYANYDESNYDLAIHAIVNDTGHIKQMPLLEINYNNNLIRYALNEAKVVDHVKTISTNIYINAKLLEYFRGSGLVFATTTGSTGYMRAINGSIIASDNNNLWQLKEIAPVANSTFSTINASIILDKTQTVLMDGELIGKSLVIDTYEYEIQTNKVELKISNKTLSLFYDETLEKSIVDKMRTLLTNNNVKRNF